MSYYQERVSYLERELDSWKQKYENLENELTERKNDSECGRAQNSSKLTFEGKNEIFVGRIGNTSANDLFEYFRQFGEIIEVKRKFNPATGASKGYAFVNFADADAQKRAAKCQFGQMKGQRWVVELAKNRENRTIRVLGVPGNISVVDFPAFKEQLCTHFEQFGPVETYSWPYNNSNNRYEDYLFVVFKENSSVWKATQQQCQYVAGIWVEVKDAPPRQQRPERFLPSGYGGARDDRTYSGQQR